MANAHARLTEAMELRGLDQTGLAQRLGATQGAISKILLGQTANSRLMPRIATLLQVPLPWLLGMSDDWTPANDRFPDAYLGNDDVEIASIDIAYGLGGTFIDDATIEIDRLTFSRSWLRNFTQAAPKDLFVARGAGDSMMPTILDSDIVLVDRSQREPKMRDHIWVMVSAGVGMIKRLRPMTDGSLLILSDNPNVPDDRATEDELFIVGRVVAVVRKM